MPHIIKVPTPNVRREYDYRDHWPYSDRVIPAAQPTIIDRVIGQELINALTIMGINWSIVLHEQFQMPRSWATTLPSSIEEEEDNADGKTLEDLFLEAKLEESRYFDEYGEIDSEWMENGTLLTRRAQIGDHVQWCRTSNDDLDSLYGEPTENRPSIPMIYREGTFFYGKNKEPRLGHTIETYADIPFDPERYDGDARFNAQNTELYGESNDLWCIDLHVREEREHFFNTVIKRRKIK